MARYIDADKVLDDMLCEMAGTGYQAMAMNVIKYAETADVVPKSEVEKFAEEIKLEFYREFDELIPSIMADKIDEIKKKYAGVEHNDQI